MREPCDCAIEVASNIWLKRTLGALSRPIAERTMFKGVCAARGAFDRISPTRVVLTCNSLVHLSPQRCRRGGRHWRRSSTNCRRGSARSWNSALDCCLVSGKWTSSILIADDHDIVRFGLVQLLHEHFPDMEIREATTFEEVLAQLENDAISVAIVDLRMPGLDDTRGLVAVRLKRPDVRLVVLTASDAQADMIEALRAGAQGYITKQEAGPQLLRALQQVMDGSVYITPNLTHHIPGQRDRN